METQPNGSKFCLAKKSWGSRNTVLDRVPNSPMVSKRGVREEISPIALYTITILFMLYNLGNPRHIL